MVRVTFNKKMFIHIISINYDMSTIIMLGVGSCAEEVQSVENRTSSFEDYAPKV